MGLALEDGRVEGIPAGPATKLTRSSPLKPAIKTCDQY